MSASDARASAGAGRGPALVGAGLVFNGAATYAFLTLAARMVGPERFSQISVLWATMFLIGVGCFVPVEQELTRVVAEHRALGRPYGAVVRRYVVVGASLLAVVSVVALGLGGVLSSRLFRGDSVFVVLLVAGLAGLLAVYVARGLLAGADRYGRYGLLFGVEGLARAVPALALAVAGVAAAWAYGLVAAVAGLVAAAVPLVGLRGRVRPGATPTWPSVARPVGLLMVTTSLMAVMMNIGPVAVELLADPSESAEAGIFLSGLVIARIPLFLCQGIQALVLPRLSRLAVVGDHAGFRREVARILGGLAAFTALAVVASAVVGPTVLRVVFGDEYALLGARDMAMLTYASLSIVLVFTINQAQIALHEQGNTSLPWAVGVAVFVGVTALAGPDLYWRVELGLAAGSTAVLVCAGALLTAGLRVPQSRSSSEDLSTV